MKSRQTTTCAALWPGTNSKCQDDAGVDMVFFFLAGVLGRLGIRRKTGGPGLPGPELCRRRRFTSQLDGRGPPCPEIASPSPALLPLRLVFCSCGRLFLCRAYVLGCACRAAWLLGYRVFARWPHATSRLGDRNRKEVACSLEGGGGKKKTPKSGAAAVRRHTLSSYVCSRTTSTYPLEACTIRSCAASTCVASHPIRPISSNRRN